MTRCAIWCGDLVDPVNRNSGWRVTEDLLRFCLFFDEVKLLNRHQSIIEADQSPFGDGRSISRLAESGLIVGCWPNDADVGTRIVQQACEKTLAWVSESSPEDRSISEGVKVPISMEKLHGVDLERTLRDAGVDARYETASPASKAWGQEECLVLPLPVASRFALSVGLSLAARESSEVVVSDVHMEHLLAQERLGAGKSVGEAIQQLVVGLLPVVDASAGDPVETTIAAKERHGTELVRFRRRLEIEAKDLLDEQAQLGHLEFARAIKRRTADLRDELGALRHAMASDGFQTSLVRVGRAMVEAAMLGSLVNLATASGADIAAAGLWSGGSTAFSAARRRRHDLRVLALLADDARFDVV